jgi:DNA topoisomerase-1
MEPTESTTDPKKSARAVGLRYVNDDIPGIRRQRRGRGFSYVNVDGELIDDPEERQRIERLVIPPAWTDVWISPLANSHLQATGRDDKGRKQYRYHPQWSEVRSQTKYNRLLRFGESLPSIRTQVEQDLALRGLPRQKVLATVVRLLETTCIRVGNKEYARANQSFGLTTLRDHHVDVYGSTIHFHFRGKSRQEHTIDLQDRRLAAIVKKCRDIPGYDLFQYLDEERQRQTISSGDVNDYLREITGEEFTAKDFRTWGGTLLAAMALYEAGPHESDSEAKENIVHAIKEVAGCLGNRPATCRKYYVHPAVLDAYLDGTLFEKLQRELARAAGESYVGLYSEETALIEILR